MGNRSKLLLLLFVAQAFMIAPVIVRADIDDDYTFTFEKIYKRIDTISFTFEGTAMTYAVIMASRFENVNASHSRLRLDVIINTVDGNLVGCLVTNISYITTFIVNGQAYQRTGEVSAKSQCFFQYGEVIYTYGVCSVDIPSNFPASVTINFEYNIHSLQFTKTNMATASATFLGGTVWIIIFIAIAAGVACAIIFGVRAAKHRRAEGGSSKSYKSSYKIQAVSKKDIKAYEKQKKAEEKAEADAAVKAEAAAKARASIAQISSLPSSEGSIPPVAPSPTICPACGGNVVNFKCQSCWGKICRGCRHLNMATSYTCEKCQKTL